MIHNYYTPVLPSVLIEPNSLVPPGQNLQDLQHNESSKKLPSEDVRHSVQAYSDQ